MEINRIIFSYIKRVSEELGNLVSLEWDTEVGIRESSVSLLVTILQVQNNGHLRFEQASQVILKEVEMGIDDADNGDSRVDNLVAGEDHNAYDDDSNGDDGAYDGCTPTQGMSGVAPSVRG